MAERKADGERRRGIQSVEIGLRVLAAVAGTREPSTLSTISQRSGLSSSQTHRYLASLVASGMVKQESRSGLYDLDFGAIKIGLAALARIDAFALADDAFRTLTELSKRTLLVAVWGDNGPVVVRWFPGDPPVVTSISIGSVLPLFQSATGRVFYAFAEPTLTEELAKKEARRIGTPLSKFAAIRQRVSEEMLASVEGDLIPGLRAIAAPVFDLQGRLVFVASMIANANFPVDQDARAREELRDACRNLTESLGGVWPS